jgi:hypothetical protein
MQSLKRDVTSGFVISAIAVVMALAWGSPFVGPHAAHAAQAQPQVQVQQQQQAAQQAKAKPHPGIVTHLSAQ